jgi:putative tryptophan/tyrosine transport system substrate-binding protein
MWLNRSLVVLIVVALCSPAEAQQARKLTRIGLVAGTSSATGGRNLEAFRQGLRDLGYVEGDNIQIEPRWTEGRAERFPGLISELINLKVDVMVVSSAAGALAAKNARAKILVVFAAVTDPFEHGLITNLARPGGNITGASLAVGEGFSGKWVELLKETVPNAPRFSVLWNPTHPVAGVFARETEAGRASAWGESGFF